MSEIAAPASSSDKTEKPKLTPEQREQLKREQIALRLKRAKAADQRLKNRDVEADRRRDTRAKIIMGALLIADAHDHPEVKKYQLELINRRAPQEDKAFLTDYLAGLAKKWIEADAAKKAAERSPAEIKAARAERAAERARKAAEEAARLAEQKVKAAQAAALKAKASPAPGSAAGTPAQPAPARDPARQQPLSDRPAPSHPQQAAPSQAPLRPQEPHPGEGSPTTRSLPPRGS